MAKRLRSMKGKAMVSLNDHPDIRQVFAGLPTLELDIRYCVQGGPERKTSVELVITNYNVYEVNDLFGIVRTSP